jgi:tetratricopeptide (TPR) repeat protein
MTPHGSKRIFVAMPGTSMGEKAKWSNPADIKKYFFERIREKVSKERGEPFDLVVEKDKRISATIHADMFAESLISDVYIADLTGRNPNVYLELGVRWAVRDSVTILVSQDLDQVGFNVSGNRVFPYSQDPAELQNAIDIVSEAIVRGLADPRCDNPVRHSSNLVQISRDELAGLKAEIERLRQQRGEDLLAAARAAEDPRERRRLLETALGVNPASVPAHLALAQELRKAGSYDKAAVLLHRAIALAPSSGEAYRELGIVCGKLKRSADAVEALRKAVQLSPNDYEALSNLGGALRRYGMRDAPDRYDFAVLGEAHNAYASAAKIQPHDTYALLNLARLDLMLSKVEPARKAAAVSQFKRLQNLCAYHVSENPSDHWRRFDLADSYLLSGDVDQGARTYAEALDTVAPEYRVSTYATVAGPLDELRLLGVLDPPVLAAVVEILARLRGANQATV